MSLFCSGPSSADAEKIRSIVNAVNEIAMAMNNKWGIGRLRLLVGDELRDRFDRQRLAYNRAVWSGNVAEVERHAAAMIRGYAALDKAATEAGAETLGLPQVWELVLPDGSIGALVQTVVEQQAVLESGQYQTVWTLEEIAAVLRRFPELVKRSAGTPATVAPEEPVDRAAGDAIPKSGIPVDYVEGWDLPPIR